MENIKTNYARCWHNCGNSSFHFFSQRLSNLLPGWLPSPLWCTVKRCWLPDVLLLTEKEANNRRTFIAQNYLILLLLDLLHQTFCILFAMSCLFFSVNHSRQIFCEMCEKRQQALTMLSLGKTPMLGEPGCHLGCLKPFTSS